MGVSPRILPGMPPLKLGLWCLNSPALTANVPTAVLATLLSATVRASNSKTVTSSLNVYGDTNTNFDAVNNSIADLNKQNDGVHNGLLNLNEKKGVGKTLLVSDDTAATVGDLRKLG